MRNSIAAGALLAASFSPVSALGAFQEEGNWYQNLVQKITYTGVGTPGSYQRVTNMANGACDRTEQPYSGAMSPMDEEISWHMRGPMNIYNFAAYYPQSANYKKEKRDAPAEERRHAHGHGHAYFHKRNQEVRAAQEEAEKRAVGDVVTAVIDGKVVHWINTYDGSDLAAQAPPTPKPAHGGGLIGHSTVPSTPATPKNSGKVDKIPAGAWKRVSLYTRSTSIGLVALNNMGGQGSGVFDTNFGNSLSYAASDASSGAAAPQQFGGTLKSNQEVIFFTDRPCSDKAPGCGYSRPGTVAYHGWGGAEKAFVIEFDMPYDGDRSFNGDMPSVWALNAQIPRTVQYNGCSCWGTGCGEFDACEVLNSGNSKCKSTYHGNNAGGSSDYMDRPAHQKMILAIVFHDDKISVEQLDSFDFGPSMSSDLLNNVAGTSGISNVASSLFSLSDDWGA